MEGMDGEIWEDTELVAKSVGTRKWEIVEFPMTKLR